MLECDKIDTEFDLHVDTVVNSYGDRPSIETIEKCRVALEDNAKLLKYRLGPLSEKWFQFRENGWLWIMGAKNNA